MPKLVEVPSVRARVSEDEWQARVELAAAYRLVAHYGWTHPINNHISLRVPNTADQFLINPYGLLYEQITASSLVKIDVDGNVLEDSPYQPFTGVYHTLMLANDEGSADARLERLVRAIKRVYASTFLRQAKDYIRATPYRLEEE